MAKLTINRGSLANDGTGDNLREGANKVNLNFDEIYTAIGDGSTVDGTIKIADDSSTVATISANGETLRILGGTAITSTLSGNTLTIAADTSGLITATGSATLTNKSIDLTDNTLTGTLAEFNTAVSDATLVDLDDTQVLTNKTINGPDNTLTNIANSSLSNSTITIRDDSSTEDAVSLGETIIATGGTGITSTVGSNQLTFAIDSTVTTLTGSQTLTNKTINGPDNTITNLANSNLSGSAGITNANLANSSFTLGDDTISLGGTDTSIANLSLTGATGTINLTSQENKIRFNYNGTGNFPSASDYEGMFAYDYSGDNAYFADTGGWVKILDENDGIGNLSNVNLGSPSAGQVLVWNSGGYFEPGNNGSGIASVVADTTPQLGGDLDAQGNDVQDVGYVSHRSPDATVTQTLTVTVASKTSEHTAFGDGSSNGYLIDGHEGAHLQLTPGVYKFDQADSSNSGHPLLFYDTASKTTQYTTNVTTSGTPGSSGAHTTITITKATPSTLHYQCSSHANMGGVVSVVGSEATRITENLRLSSSGNSAQTRLSVGDDDVGSVGTTGKLATFSQDLATTFDGTNVGTIGGINIINNDETSNRTASGITLAHRSSSSGIAYIASTSTAADRGDLRIGTRGSGGIAERVRITDEGNFQVSRNGAALNVNSTHQLIDDLANSYSLMLSNKASSPASQYMLEIGFKSASPDNNSARFVQCLDSTTTRAEIMSDGDLRNHDNSYGSTSDERIKQDIIDAGSQWADIKAFRIRKFKKKDDVRQYGAENAKVQIGVIAQELETVSPGLIKEQEPGVGDIQSSSEFGELYQEGDTIPEGKAVGDIKTISANVKSVNYSVLYMKAIKALQEAQTRIETLETKVTALENA